MDYITTEKLIARGKELPRLIEPFLPEQQLDELLRDTPYMQRVHEQFIRQGIEQGIEQGRRKVLDTHRRHIVETLMMRLGLTE